LVLSEGFAVRNAKGDRVGETTVGQSNSLSDGGTESGPVRKNIDWKKPEMANEGCEKSEV
ncbi:MAG TPA: hypothetical protein PLO20_09715, partial [Thermogutta sp.]|nr:hypothetical protein [Thermogutta sp.]